MTKDELAIFVEVQALKLLLLTAIAGLPEAEAILLRFEKRLAELEGHALFEPIISDPMRDGIAVAGKGFAEQIRKWARRPSAPEPDS